MWLTRFNSFVSRSTKTYKQQNYLGKWLTHAPNRIRDARTRKAHHPKLWQHHWLWNQTSFPLTFVISYFDVKYCLPETIRSSHCQGAICESTPVNDIQQRSRSRSSWCSNRRVKLRRMTSKYRKWLRINLKLQRFYHLTR